MTHLGISIWKYWHIYRSQSGNNDTFKLITSTNFWPFFAFFPMKQYPLWIMIHSFVIRMTCSLTYKILSDHRRLPLKIHFKIKKQSKYTWLELWQTLWMGLKTLTGKTFVKNKLFWGGRKFVSKGNPNSNLDLDFGVFHYWWLIVHTILWLM